MNFFDRLNIYFYHKDRNKKWPDNPPKILGWRDEESQLSRFRIIAKQYDFNHKSVLDLGCGYGDFKPFIDQYYDIAYYTGFDQQKAFIQEAKIRQLTASKFFNADFARDTLPKHDIVIASGSLNYHSCDSNYLVNMIDRMYQAANEVVIFNLLNAKTFPEDTLLKGYHSEHVLSYCRNLSSDCYIEDKYSKDDFTVVLKKSKPPT
ncbi:class I SAM-dependent methyltransferase [Photobacterium sanguinicancri]|uniref:Class I SAM-dependent methyltransferase n=1 Tax=Photobacterium sanguinicancri TaxID=875932 RepID=A0AAW7Y496_9GAMM|nr:class I SAM-dependent methyltransferase [Photobacterium sanguinicancri]MDO6541788.1 class I SAM-dependent methyltransferase [Photobacterium sanguinicancri]